MGLHWESRIGKVGLVKLDLFSPDRLGKICLLN